MLNDIKFPCNKCGKCCLKVGLSKKTKHLDRGDLGCVNFDDKTNLCLIYENRPIYCRVDDYYYKNLSKILSWEEYVEINRSICNQFQTELTR